MHTETQRYHLDGGWVNLRRPRPRSARSEFSGAPGLLLPGQLSRNPRLSDWREEALSGNWTPCARSPDLRRFNPCCKGFKPCAPTAFAPVLMASRVLAAIAERSTHYEYRRLNSRTAVHAPRCEHTRTHARN